MAEVAVEITTSSEQMTAPPWPTPSFPKITLNGNPLPSPANPGSDPSGVQLVVLNPAVDITTPESIITNEYFYLYDEGGGWSSTYQYTWNYVTQGILTSGNIDQQIVFLITFGWDQNAPPSSFPIEMMLELGAGPQLQKWVTNCDPGSMGGSWVSFPASYILVGTSAWGYGQGAEQYTDNAGATTLTTTLQNVEPPPTPPTS